MKYIVLIIGIFLSCSANSSGFSQWLKETNPSGLFPDVADYTEYSNVCNESVCFHLVAVHYVTETNKGMRRLAVFSKNGCYLGDYSGFNEMPVKAVGSQLLFPESTFGSFINFNGKVPPVKVFIDGESYKSKFQLSEGGLQLSAGTTCCADCTKP